MAEENGGRTAGETGGVPSVGETSLRAELERIRSHNKIFKTVTVVFAVIFAGLCVLGYVAWRRISRVKAVLEGVAEGFLPMASGFPGAGGNVPEPVRAVSGAPFPQISGLGLLSMPADGDMPSGGIAPGTAAAEQGKKMLQVMSKYSDRPVVKEFLADLEKDPAFARAKKEKEAGNPLAMLASMQKSTGMKDLMLKYSRRSDFMKLMMEVMQDPEMRPFMKGMPAGGGTLPGVVPAAPAAAAVSRPPPQSSADMDGDDEITFDASAVSGPDRPAAESAAKKPIKAPPPIDNGQ